MNRIQFIARIRHIAWIGFQIAVEQPRNDEPTEEQLTSLENGVKFALEHPFMTSEENHENWMKMKASQGWKYGPVKDFAKKEHPDMVPYDQLPLTEKLKDYMDKIVNRLADELYEKIAMSKCFRCGGSGKVDCDCEICKRGVPFNPSRELLDATGHERKECPECGGTGKGEIKPERGH